MLTIILSGVDGDRLMFLCFCLLLDVPQGYRYLENGVTGNLIGKMSGLFVQI